MLYKLFSKKENGMKIDNYEIFFALRDKYPHYRAIIGMIMSYAFSHDDIIAGDYLYLGEYKQEAFFEENIKLIFRELGLDVVVCLPSHKITAPHLIVRLKTEEP